MKNAILNLSFMDSEIIEEVHEASLCILKETGIMIDSEKVFKTLKDHGIVPQVVDQKRGKTFWNVKFSRDIIEKALETAPKSFILGGKTPEHDLDLDGTGSYESVYYGTLGSAPMIHDLHTGQRRLGTLKDLALFSRLADSLANIDFIHVMVMPNDVPKPVIDLYRWKTVFENTNKHSFTAAVYDGSNMPFLLEMASIIAGGENELRRRPIFSATECPISPLYFEKRSAENIVDLAKAGIPVLVYSEPFAGASSPVTLAGTLVVTNAESLAGIALTQVASPGAPVIMSSVASVMDLRTGNISFGAAETGLLNAATSAMARFYRIPNHTTGGRTDSKVPDSQAGFEKQGNLLMAVLAGSNINNFAGMLESNYTASYKQLVIDDQIIAQTKRYLKGFSVTKEKLAVNIIKEVGPAGQFLKNQHTLKHMREELSLPKLSSKGTYDDWIKKGGKSLEEVANKTAQEILETRTDPILDKKTIKELERIVQAAQKMHDKKQKIS
jgi:trimethylamine--corrinoid protein Co-methyltransferase